MIDNFERIESLLEFPKNGDSFYFLQILQRKKDFPGVRLGGSNNNSRLIKAYYIKSKEELNIHKEEIIKLCDLFGARAGINLNPRSFEKAAFALLVKLANQYHNRNFADARKAYDSVCGDYHAEMDKRWLIDIDSQDEEEIKKLVSIVETIQREDYFPNPNKPDEVARKILAFIPSKNGWHIITQPFNLFRFSSLTSGSIEVHKNNPTNLYIP